MKGIWTYRDLLPEVDNRARITLGEGNTPLVKSRHIGQVLGLENLYFKLENLNPTGSYKDRFAAMAVSRFLEQGVQVCLATSSGNTGAALAAFCAVARVSCVMAIVDGAPLGKLRQMQLYGAATLMVKDFGKRSDQTDRVMALLRTLAEERGTTVQISAYCCCPEAMEGVQTMAYEIAESLDKPADVFVPAGGGGLTLAVARGFARWENVHNWREKNQVHCVQPTGNDTIATRLATGAGYAAPVAGSNTAISGLQVPNVLDGNEVIAACRSSGGTGFAVTDEKVLECQDWLAKQEGIYCEPAGAVALAGVRAAVAAKVVAKEDPVVCIVSGHGFKDLDSAVTMAASSTNTYLESEEELKKYITELIK